MFRRKLKDLHHENYPLVFGTLLFATSANLTAQAAEQEPQVVAETISSSEGDRDFLRLEHTSSPDPFVIDVIERPDQSRAGDNHAVSMGWNAQALDSNKPAANAMGITFERNYANGRTAAGFEFHLQTRSADDVYRRAMSFFLPRD